MKSLRLILPLTIALLILAPSISRSDIIIITHPDNPMTNLDKDQLKRIFLGVKRKRASGEKITIIDQFKNNNIRKEFYREFTGKSVAQINSRWAGLLFSGKASPPQQVLNDQAVKAWLQTHPFGFGYIHSSNVDPSIKEVMKIKIKQAPPTTNSN